MCIHEEVKLHNIFFCSVVLSKPIPYRSVYVINTRVDLYAKSAFRTKLKNIKTFKNLKQSALKNRETTE